ncbi:MAG: hypothetical protein JSV79_12730 [Armatimonadota bacterium]|nr:MAG: hypothetical protein JSV79_12730 [Armatimonadota bacterium]
MYQARPLREIGTIAIVLGVLTAIAAMSSGQFGAGVGFALSGLIFGWLLRRLDRWWTENLQARSPELHERGQRPRSRDRSMTREEYRKKDREERSQRSKRDEQTGGN